MERKDIAIVSGLFFVALVIRAAGISNVNLHPDEFTYWTMASKIITNGFSPTPDVFQYTNPSFSYILASVIAVFKGDLNTLRLMSALFGSASVSLLYLFGKEIYDRRVGMLASLFLCFLPCHCLYSRIIKLEAFSIFFIIAFLFFFWRGIRYENARANEIEPNGTRVNVKYAAIAGVMLGLAISAKYLSLFLVVALVVFFIWTATKENARREAWRVFLVLVFAFLAFSPLLVSLFYTGIDLSPITYHAFERFGIEAPTNIRVSEFSLSELANSIIENLLKVLCRGSWLFPPSFEALFKASVLVLFFATGIYYVPKLLRAERKGSFLLLSLLSLTVVLLFCARHEHYLSYMFPLYFVMLSFIIVSAFDVVHRLNIISTSISLLVLMLVAVMLFAYVTTGVTSPFWDRGDASWGVSAAEFIHSDAVREGYEDVVIGMFLRVPQLEYYLEETQIQTNISVVSILALTEKEYSKEVLTIDFECIKALKPEYIVVHDIEWESLVKTEDKKELLQDYDVILHTSTHPYRCQVLKRWERMQRVPQKYTVSGSIDKELFKRSVPDMLKVGKVYTALVKVKNMDTDSGTFIIRVLSDKYIVRIPYYQETVYLEKGSERTLKFKIVPLKKYTGGLPITADLYLYDEKNETNIKVDTAIDNICLIN